MGLTCSSFFFLKHLRSAGLFYYVVFICMIASPFYTSCCEYVLKTSSCRHLNALSLLMVTVVVLLNCLHVSLLSGLAAWLVVGSLVDSLVCFITIKERGWREKEEKKKETNKEREGKNYRWQNSTVLRFHSNLWLSGSLLQTAPARSRWTGWTRPAHFPPLPVIMNLWKGIGKEGLSQQQQIK